MPRQRAVFLDRDGVINRLIYHRDAGIVDSPFTIEQFHILPQVTQAIRRLNNLGVRVVMVSNQPGIAKGHFDIATLRQFEAKLQTRLQSAGARIDAVYYCLHHPQATVKALRRNCRCRKPSAGMLTRAARDLDLSLPDSYMIGDGLTDIEAGAKAGCRTVFVGRWKCEHENFIHPRSLRPNLVAKDLWEAVSLVQKELKSYFPKSRKP